MAITKALFAGLLVTAAGTSSNQTTNVDNAQRRRRYMDADGNFEYDAPAGGQPYIDADGTARSTPSLKTNGTSSNQTTNVDTSQGRRRYIDADGNFEYDAPAGSQPYIDADGTARSTPSLNTSVGADISNRTINVDTAQRRRHYIDADGNFEYHAPAGSQPYIDADGTTPTRRRSAPSLRGSVSTSIATPMPTQATLTNEAAAKPTLNNGDDPSVPLALPPAEITTLAPTSVISTSAPVETVSVSAAFQVAARVAPIVAGIAWLVGSV